MSNNELLDIISKPWLDVKDIKKIALCGDNAARKIMKEISQSILSSGKKLPPSKKKIIPTKDVLDYLGIDIDYLIEIKKILEGNTYGS